MKNIQNGWYVSVLPVLLNTMLQVHKELYIRGKVKNTLYLLTYMDIANTNDANTPDIIANSRMDINA